MAIAPSPTAEEIPVMIPVAGDLIPAVAAIVVGILVLYEDYYMRKVSAQAEDAPTPKAFLLGY
ncbi:MAG: hypothetical protein OQK29_07280, partial [Ignavibacteriaceae bacterium]|nr:hypothetical protein [Ignavibacteriaceae bacterium]